MASLGKRSGPTQVTSPAFPLADSQPDTPLNIFVVVSPGGQ